MILAQFPMDQIMTLGQYGTMGMVTTGTDWQPVRNPFLTWWIRWYRHS